MGVRRLGLRLASAARRRTASLLRRTADRVEPPTFEPGWWSMETQPAQWDAWETMRSVTVRPPSGFAVVGVKLNGESLYRPGSRPSLRVVE